MKKCFAVFNIKARFRNSKGRFEPIRREFYATDPADALRQFGEQIETAGPSSSVKEWEGSFDEDSLFNFIQNTPEKHSTARVAAQTLRAMVDRSAAELAKENGRWHDDPAADDHPLYHAGEFDQFPREIRNKAILALVARHLEIIDENEAARKSKEEQSHE